MHIYIYTHVYTHIHVCRSVYDLYFGKIHSFNEGVNTQNRGHAPKKACHLVSSCVPQETHTWAAVKINCCCLVWKYRLSLFGGGPYRFTVFLFKSTLHNAKIQRNWLHEFRSLYCRGWIKGALVVFAFATMLGSYLSTFLDSFLSKEIYCNLNSKSEWQ